MYTYAYYANYSFSTAGSDKLSLAWHGILDFELFQIWDWVSPAMISKLGTITIGRHPVSV